ncbi:hypothetical protein FB567DRAFT_257590 [Paraphoma chrysanthemicola]|uniref:Uncharacterized protein n=1 Tax=Paraphoma chrysanthemicola TaxID=798071 RepID=A0A8K0QRY3_9PLEO|nr:hypothetical protein FB567DRAFT_257590 [Paraphoma chrysanthemicola]
MLFLFDTLLSLIAALYILDFIVTIHSNTALCKASKTRDIPIWSLQLAHQREQEEAEIHTEKFITLSAQERCLRLTGTILIAGGFACGVAAILATLHLASILCRFCEAFYIWLLRRRLKSEVAEHIEPRATDPDWRNPPRDIDIHTRTAREGGLLTGISEEEQNTGGVLRRRKQANATRSNGSVKSKTSSALEKIEDVLLECLVP